MRRPAGGPAPGGAVSPDVRTLSLLGPPRAGRLRRYLGTATRNPAGSIYGTVVATSVIAIEGVGNPSMGDLIGTDLLTVLVYWAAHVYAAVLASPPQGDSAPPGGSRSDRRRVLDAMSHEWPLVAGSFLPLLAVLVGRLFVDEVSSAALIGLWAGVLLLYGWGFAASRAGGRSRPASVAYGLVAALLGIVVIALRFLLH